jgi:asparagine synthase (glutamine-hydrolysing)
MLAALLHRGPDAAGTLERPGIVAAMRRLAVIDLEGGNQPLFNEDGSVAVISNGEIYNHRELRRRLERAGHRFRTRSDTEVLAHLWEERGAEMLHELNGMFALCLHDARSGETLIARDRLGIKPLFYRHDPRGVVFASELAALVRHPGVSAAVDPAALVELFRLQYVCGEGTVYRDVRKLLPGHRIRIADGAVRVERWYEPPPPRARPGLPLETAAAELDELLAGSVEYRLLADVPLGVFLSGGVDSGVVLEQVARRVHRPVKTFSVGFEGEAAFDEREYAKLVAETFGTEHHELVVSALDIARRLPRLVEHLAEPVTDPAIIPTLLLAEFARREVTVVLTGEGADELFGGYRRYGYQTRFGWVGRLPGVRGAGDGAIGGLLPRRVGQALGALAEHDPALQHLEWSSTLGRSVAAKLFEPDVLEGDDRRLRERFGTYFACDPQGLEQQLQADQHEWLPHNLLAKVDRATMAHSLEARVPFLDHRIVEWAATLPAELKIRGTESKRVLRHGPGRRLPRRILERPKQGFDLPLAAWIRGPLRSLVGEALQPDRLRRFGGLRVAGVTEMLGRHQAGAQDYGLPLFCMLSIMLFLDFVESGA